MRLFIAIDLPENVKLYLQDLQRQLPHEVAPPWRGINCLAEPRLCLAEMVLTKDSHLTLKFLGDCSEEQRSRIETALKKIKFPQFKAQLTNIGTFGGSTPRVVWIGVKVPDHLLHTVHVIEAEMSRLGFAAENRFAPHLTLARVKHVKDPSDFATVIKGIKVEPMEFVVSDFYLFKSDLSSAGARYTKLAKFP